MKKFLVTLLCLNALWTLAQNNTGVRYTLKKEGQTITITLPPETVINNDNKITIKGKPAIIEAIDKNIYDSDTIKAEEKDPHILIRYNLKGLKPVTTYEEQHVQNSQWKKNNKNELLLFWENTFVYKDHPEKLNAAKVVGDSILTISMENDSVNYDDAKKMLLDAVESAVATQAERPLKTKT